MPKLIDKVRVAEMLGIGFTQAEIAKRLDCSDRQIRRIRKRLNLKNSTKLVESEDHEFALRNFFLSFESGEKVAEKFGLTRQAILK